MEQVLRINGAELRMRASGVGPDLLMIHGFPVNAATWDALLPALESRFRCWRVDLPGLWDGEWHPQADFRFLPRRNASPSPCGIWACIDTT